MGERTKHSASTGHGGTERLIDLLARRLLQHTGREFLQGLARELASSIPGADCACVAQLEGDHLRVVALAGDPRVCAEVSEAYPVAGTPCARALEDGVFVAASDLARNFPASPLLRDGGVRAYAGVRLDGRDGGTVGLAWVVSRSGLPEPEASRAALEAVAARAAAEVERVGREARLEAERTFLQQVVDAVPLPLMVVEPDHRLVLANRAARAAHGRPPDAPLPAESCHSFAHGRDHPCEALPCPVTEVLRTGGPVRLEHAHEDPSGEVRLREVHAGAIRDSSGRIVAVVETYRDVTEERRAREALLEHSERLDFLAHHDPLTGLPNRTLLRDRLQRAIARADREGRCAAAIFIDLDHFKAVNDRHGHAVGDRVLAEVARRMRDAVRTADTVGRIGGDEFVAIVDDLEEPEDCLPVARKLLAAARLPVVVGRLRLRVGASAGIALHPVDATDPDALLRAADAAMYRAKGTGGARFFTAEIERRTRRRAEFEEAVARALAEGGLELRLEPAVEAGSGRRVRFEALPYLAAPGRRARRVVAAGIPDERLVARLAEWTFRRAAEAAARHAERISVDAPAPLLHEGRLLRLLDALPTGCVDVEIPEGALAALPSSADALAAELDRRGWRVLLDRTGAAGLPLHRLARLPLAAIKARPVDLGADRPAQLPRAARLLADVAGVLDTAAILVDVHRRADLPAVVAAAPGLLVQGRAAGRAVRVEPG